MPADHAEPQMNPLIARFQALFAAIRVRFDILNLIEVCTVVHIGYSISVAYRTRLPTFRS
jgi:hypothetical protein